MVGHFLHAENSMFLIIDLQEKLMKKMKYSNMVYENTILFTNLCKLLDIPIAVTEQYPKGLGCTAAPIADELGLFQPLEKISFSACTEDILDELRKYNRRQILVAGSETHICVFQTVRDLLASGFEVYILSDAVCSRFKNNYKNGIRLMEREGAIITDTETAIYDLLKEAGTPEFKAMLPLIK